MSLEQSIAAVGIAGCMLGAFVGPLFSDARYSSITNTLSELAGQKMPNAWVMRGGFFVFGLGVLTASWLRWEQERVLCSALMLFGLSMIGAAI